MAVQDMATRPPSPSIFNDPTFRAVAAQVILLILVLLVGYELYRNASTNLANQKIASGLGFLDSTAGFGINQTLISYSETSSYGRAFWVGLLNTLLVAGFGLVLATILGFVVGIGRLSKNFVINKLATVYVEITRNLPLLFQILFWYLAVINALPAARQSISLLDVAFLNIRGLYVPRVLFGEGADIVGGALVVAIAAVVALKVWSSRRQARTGQQFPVLRTSIAVLVGLPFLVSALLGFPVGFELPELKGFNFQGGVRVIPEFVALLLALSIYTGGFIAEIVRAGIQAVSHGQTEAAYSLGLKPGQTLRLVVVPQALRVIIPPLTSQYLNLTKNSSLAVAIGYPDLVAVFAGTVLNQTGQAIEVISITMACYLLISIATSLFMNWYNQRVALVER